MNDSQKAEFAETMFGVGELYSKSISKNLMKVYWNALKRFDLEHVVDAISKHVDNPDSGQFMPKPADIVKHIEGSNKTAGMLAWSKVSKAVSQVGSYHSVVFDDPLIHAVITDIGGWISLCNITEEEAKFKANEFAKRYEGYKINPPNEYQRKLIGISEAHNSTSGHYVEQPVLIGNRENALLVYQSGSDQAALEYSVMPDQVKKISSELSED